MAHLALGRLVAAFLLAGGIAYGQSTTNPATAPDSGEPAAASDRAFLDLFAGRVFGATIGMDEEATRKALTDNNILDIKKVEYPGHFLLQSPSCLGIAFNFRGKKELNDIYTNSRNVRLSHGLKLGDPVTKFTEVLGKPALPTPLPSGVGDQLVYRLGDLELSIICLYSDPTVAHALALRRTKPL